MCSDGNVYRISAECMVIDKKTPVELSYTAFLRMSNKDSQIGIETLLSPIAISDGVGYTSRNISVVNIPNIGMAWACRVSTTLPENVAKMHNISDRRIGTDFLFFWPPAKALAAHIAVVEQTRIDNRTRFLSECDPSPTSLFTDWNAVISNAGTPVDPYTLTTSQRLFAASFKPMVHLASPRYTIDLYCTRRLGEDAFLHKNAPIQLKYSGLERIRQHEQTVENSPTQSRKRAKCTNSNTKTTDENEPPVSTKVTELLHGHCVMSTTRQDRSGSSPFAQIIDKTARNWISNVPEDVQCCIIESVVHGALNTMDDAEAVESIRNMRLVCRSFRKKTDESVHTVLVDAFSNAKRVCEPTVDAHRLGGLLLRRSWWDKCKLPYMSLITYPSETPRTSVATLARIVASNSHNPYPLCKVVPTLDLLNHKRESTMQCLQKKVNELATNNPAFTMTMTL
jgi:hypothetical protein